jgi:hypothetical protein
VANGFYSGSVAGALVTIPSGAANYIWALASTVASNNVTVYYTITNLVATNTLQIAVGTNANICTTNLYTKLATDYAPYLSLAYVSSNLFSLVTIGNPGFTLTNSAAWATNQLTTNILAGGINFVASNSLDQIVWVPDAAKNFSLAYSASNLVGCISNWTTIGSIPYWKFTAANAFTNGGSPRDLRIKTVVKPNF